MFCSINAWLCVGAFMAISCPRFVLGGGYSCTPVPQGQLHTKDTRVGDVSLFQGFLRVESQAKQWGTDDNLTVDALSTKAAASDTMPPTNDTRAPLQEHRSNVERGSANYALICFAAFALVVLSVVMCVFVSKLQTPEPSKDKPKVEKSVSRTVTMLSVPSMSVRSECSVQHFGTIKPAGKLLSDRILGRSASTISAPGARMIERSSTSFGVDGAHPSLAMVQRVSSQHPGQSPPQSEINLSFDGKCKSFVNGVFPVAAHGDCRFVVPVDTLVESAGGGTFCITAGTSETLWRVAIAENKDSLRSLRVFVGGDSATPSMTVCATTGPGLQILNATGQHFGKLVLQPNGSFSVITADQRQLLVIEGNEANLDLRISSRDGRPMAAVSCNETASAAGVEQIEFRVLPGADPVLMISCILSVLLLGNDDDEK